MSEDREPAVDERHEAPASNRRILILMGLTVIVGTTVSMVVRSTVFGFGFLFGGIIAFINYFWLKATLGDIFEKVVSGNSSGFSSLRFFFRYLMLGVILAVVYISGVIPIAAVIFGLCSFAFAVMIEAAIRVAAPQNGERGAL